VSTSGSRTIPSFRSLRSNYGDECTVRYDLRVNEPCFLLTNAESKNKKKKKSKKKVPSATTTGDSSADIPVSERAPVDTGNAKESDDSEPEDSDVRPVPASTDTSIDEETVTQLANGVQVTDLSDDATARFDALVKDRDALRAEVTQLRESLEGLQAQHTSELEAVQTELEETQNEKQSAEEQKDAAEEQYQNLLGKVNTIRSQLAERMKSDAEDLAQARTQIEELEEQKSTLQEQYTARSSEVEDLKSQVQEQSKELSSLRNRSNLSQQNWTQEKEELLESEAYLREEFDNAKQAMHDWEVLAMEERTIRKDLADRVADLEEQLAGVKENYERAKEERDTQSSTVEGLQKALQEIQTLRKTELKEIVENSQSELATLKEQLEQVQSAETKSRTELEETKRELERALPFEKEVKEKNLLIGKLRHEGVILNDHLTKALRFLKKGKPEDNVDRYVACLPGRPF
jgi:chromosome segregation ATPase